MAPRQRSPLRCCWLLLVLPISLAGCTGIGEFVDHTFSNPARNPNRIIDDSENVRLVYGLDLTVEPLEMEPGNIWPKFDARDPTLRDTKDHPGREGKLGLAPIAASSDQSALPGERQLKPHQGSATLSGQIKPLPFSRLSLSTVSLHHAATAPKPLSGAVNISQDPALTGGPNFYRQLNRPPSSDAIVVPSGNGTSTVITPDGNVQTIPTRP